MEVQQHFENIQHQLVISKSPCIPIQSQRNGIGLYAKGNIHRDSIVFTEKPIVAGQYSWGVMYSYTACHHCLKSLETPLEMAKRLTNNSSLTLPIPDSSPTVHPTQFKFCPSCNVIFCCEECLGVASRQYHNAVCTNGDLEHPLQKLDELWRNMHYPPETTSLLMLVKIIGIVITSGSIPAIFKHFYQTVEKEGSTHKVLQPEFISQLEIVRDGLLQIYGSSPLIDELLQRDNFITLIALIGMNGQGIGTSSFTDYCNRVDRLNLDPNDKEKISIALDDMYDKIEEVSGVFDVVEGTGLYELQSKLNHSCRPNLQIVFEKSNDELSVQALQDIKDGEELCISYLSTCQLSSSRHSRRKFLSENYMFECECGKCTEQRSDPDVTSEEEESDMEE